MLNEGQRQDILREAEAWKGTKYRGHSCVKKAGADCGQALYGIYRACGLLPEITNLPTDYSLQVSKHRGSRQYVTLVETFFREIPESAVLPGDVVVYKLGHAFAHGGIVKVWPDFVWQATAEHGFMGLHGTKEMKFQKRLRRFFTLKDDFCGGWGSFPATFELAELPEHAPVYVGRTVQAVTYEKESPTRLARLRQWMGV